MKRLILLATVVAAFGWWDVASGEGSPPETPPGPVTGTGCCPRALLSGCPDDYHRKPWPRIWCLSCGQPDDYCRKPCPNPCRPLCSDHYTCGGSAGPMPPGLAGAGSCKKD